MFCNMSKVVQQIPLIKDSFLLRETMKATWIHSLVICIFRNILALKLYIEVDKDGSLLLILLQFKGMIQHLLRCTTHQIAFYEGFRSQLKTSTCGYILSSVAKSNLKERPTVGEEY